MHLSQKLNIIMTQQNVTAYKMSKDTGISDRLIGYWKKGDKLPSAENLIIIAKYFSISVDYLLGLTDVPNSLTLSQENHSILSEEEEHLVHNFNMLNETGKISLLQYLNFMVNQPENLKNPFEATEINA